MKYNILTFLRNNCNTNVTISVELYYKSIFILILVRQTIEHHVHKLCAQLAESFIKTLKIENRDEILSKTDEVVKNIIESTEDVSRQIDKLIQNTIQIPKHLTLPEDKPKTMYTEDDELDRICKLEVLFKYYKQVN